jgi:uncharacterized protein YtpQ (UPF0354 family)
VICSQFATNTYEIKPMTTPNPNENRFDSLKQEQAQWEQLQSQKSSNEAPIYIAFRHPLNFFEIDYPAHWEGRQDDEGVVEIGDISLARPVGIMLFRVPLQIDTTIIEKSGRWEDIATSMFAQAGSTQVRHDPNIVYSNFTAERPEPDQAGQRWFVLCADLIIGISTDFPPSTSDLVQPIFERMLSSFRVYRDDEHLAVRIMQRVEQRLREAMPGTDIQVHGLTIKTEKLEVSIGNLLSEIKRNPAQLEQMVDRFVQGTIGVTQAEKAIGRETWELSRHRIQPLLKSDKYIQEVNQRTVQREGSQQLVSTFLVSLPWLTDLRICFAIDNKDTFRFVNSNDIQRWEVSLESLLEVAIENLSLGPNPELLVMRVDDESPAIAVLQPKRGASSSYLLHPRLFETVSAQLGSNIAAAVPSRDALMLFEYRGDKEFIQHAVRQDFANTNHPISDRLFRVTPDGIALL